MLQSEPSIMIDEDLKPIVLDLETDASMSRHRRVTNDLDSDDEA